jgi:hypothetical protein
MRTERAIPLLKSVCGRCWQECDIEATGWLEPFEARVCLARILDTLQETDTLMQLAALIAPPIDTTHTNGVYASSSSAAAAASSPSVAVESELRVFLSKLIVDLSRRESLESEFAIFLDHIEARPAQMPHAFTPPVGQRKASRQSPRGRADRNGHANGSVASTVTADATSPTPHADASVSSPLEDESTVSAPAPTGASTAALLDRKVFRYEFNTAVVTWIEAQIVRRMFSTEQNGTQA